MNMKFASFGLQDKNADMLGLSELLVEYPLAEVFIPLSEKNSSFSAPGWSWVSSLVFFINSRRNLVNTSLSIEGIWSEAFCKGMEIKEISSLLNMKDCNGDYFFKRIMLSLPPAVCNSKYVAKLAYIIKKYPLRRFVLPYNKDSESLIADLYRLGISFDLIYDDDFCFRKKPVYSPPVYTDIVQGYSGGLTPGNLVNRLDIISKVNSANTFIYAKNGLHNSFGLLDIEKCARYLARATKWKHNIV